MPSKKPYIPKKLAARIRGAQAKVQNARETLVHCHKRRLQAHSELDTFHRDPEAYAARNYGQHGVDSYPVQTRKSRLAEEVGYRTSRIAELEGEIPQAEAALAEVESQVLAEIETMRPSNGRVPWPKPLPAFTGKIARGLKAQQREIDAEPALRDAYMARLDAEFAQEKAREDAITQAEDEVDGHRFAALSPTEQEAERAEVRLFMSLLEKRGLTTRDLFSGLGVSEHFHEITAEMRRVGK